MKYDTSFKPEVAEVLPGMDSDTAPVGSWYVKRKVYHRDTRNMEGGYFDVSVYKTEREARAACA